MASRTLGLSVVLLLGGLLLSGRASAGRFADLGTTLNIPAAMGAAWGDYDNDGYPDLYIGGTGPCVLLHNNGNGTFTDVTAAKGLDTVSYDEWGCAWGDYNNDGRLDLIIIGGSHTPHLYRNDGDHFTDVGATAGFAPMTGAFFGRGASWGDFDGDNWLDLFVSYNDYGPSVLYHNNRDGTFSNVTAAAGMGSPMDGMGCAWADYNNDGFLDVAMTRQRSIFDPAKQTNAYLFTNKGDGTFSSGSFPGHDSTGVAWGDYNNDGWLDVFIGNGRTEESVFCMNTGGHFDSVLDLVGMSAVSMPTRGTAWADYDNDGFLDLIVGPASGSIAPFLFHNNGDGTFTDLSLAEGVSAGRNYTAICWADFDRDGSMDLLGASDSDTSLLYHNLGSPGDGHWLRVRALTSATGDATDGSPVRDALGARILVNLDNDLSFPPGRTLTRMVDGGSGFMGQNEPIGQFGLGTATTVAVQVVFPNHHIVTENGVAANQQIEVRDVAQGIGLIQGTVTDAGSGNPVIGGSVTYSYLRAITDGSGGYLLPVVPEGTYSVTASGAGFGSLTMDSVVVVSGAATTVDFALQIARGTVTGTVRDAVTLQPLGGVTVYGGQGETISAADGTYALAAWPGTWTITAVMRGYDAGEVSNVEVVDQQTTSGIDFPLQPWTISDWAVHPEIIVHSMSGNTFPNGNSYSPVITPDGRYVVFASSATDLVPLPPGQTGNVFLLDRSTGQIELISKTEDGSQAIGGSAASVSANGRYVAYSPVVLPPDVPPGVWQTYVYDRETSSLTLASAASDGTPADSIAHGTISANGRYVCFSSDATNLVPDDTNGQTDVFVHNLLTKRTVRVSVASNGAQADGPSTDPCISADGRYVAFSSAATNLVAGDTNGIIDTFLHDLTTATTERVSLAEDGSQQIVAPDNWSGVAMMSHDGRFVAFCSDANDLVPIYNTYFSPIGHGNVYLRDRVAGTTEFASLMPGDAPATPYSLYHPSYPVAVSADGQMVAFYYVVPGTYGGGTGYIVVRDRTGIGSVVLYNAFVEGGIGGDPPDMSANGRFVVTASQAGSDSVGAIRMWEPHIRSFGTVSGAVTDATTGGPIPYADIWIGGNLYTAADANGTFTIDVAETTGTTVKATAHGHGAATQTGVVITAGQTTTVDLVLPPQFTDVPAGFWAESAIASLVDAGIVQGYSDGTYKPTEPVSRDQMAVYVSRALAGGDANVPTGPATASFPDDVPTDQWAYKYVEYAVAQGVVQGYDATHYQPTLVVDRGQMAVFIARAKGWVTLSDALNTAPQLFPDVPAGYWSGVAIKACVDHNVVKGYEDGTYKPADPVTRDQMAVYIARAFQLPM